MAVVSDLPAAHALGAAGRMRVLAEATTEQEADRFVEILQRLPRG